MALRKIFGIALVSTVNEEAENDEAQFGFQPGTSALEALVLAIAHTQLPGLVTIAVDQKGAYDTINRPYLMEPVRKRHSPTTAALIAMVLQQSQVYTKGDDRRRQKSLDLGLLQGGPESPALFKIVADLLLEMIQEALQAYLTGADPDPKKGFADDLLLQLLTLLNAKRALGACTRWERLTGQTFTVTRGKSASLVREHDPADLGLRINGKSILPAQTFQYLGVTLSATGPTPASLINRVEAASAALTSIRTVHVLVRGIDVAHANNLYETFIVPKWMYACFLQPLPHATLLRLLAIDAGYISAVLVACRVAGTGRRRSMLPTLRAIMRLPSPQLRRQTAAHRYTARLIRMQQDPRTPHLARARAKAAHDALLQVPSIPDLVADTANPWDRDREKAQQAEEWRWATAHKRRPVPAPGPGPTYYPPAARLRQEWARALAARYHCSTFPILHRTLPTEGPREHTGRRPRPLTETAITIPDEKTAMLTLRLLHDTACSPTHLRAITAALRTLRPRENWARGRQSTE